MGAGFTLFVDPEDAEVSVKLAEEVGVRAWIAGHVEAGERRVIIEPLGVTFAGPDLNLRI
jgi:phosphoribosylformylglycinamidine cyclo-ligase